MEETQEKKVLFEVDSVLPEKFFIKPLYDKRGKIFQLIFQILHIIVFVQSIVLFFIDHTSGNIWLMLPILFVIIDIMVLWVNPRKIKKSYRKLQEEGEDHQLFTFYNDSVRMKSPAVEAVFKYDTAEDISENDERIMISFSLKRHLTVNKACCTPELQEFIRNIVPEEKLKKKSRKKTISHVVKIVLEFLYVLVLVWFIMHYCYVNKNTYVLEYQSTTYSSFINCLAYGSVDNVLIINDKYVEYDYTGNGKHERYYTKTDDAKELIEFLDEMDVSWDTEDALYFRNK